MKIYLLSDDRLCPFIQDYLNHNKIPYEHWDLWDFSKGSRLLLPPGKFLFFLSYRCLEDMSDWQEFANRINQSDGICYFADRFDSTNRYISYKTFFALLTCEFYLHQDAKLHIQAKETASQQMFNFSSMILNQYTLKNKYNRNKDFLLTAIIKNNRPQRKLLIDKLNEHNLLENFAGIVKSVSSHDQWIGLKDKNNDILSLSWDLYYQAYYELISETRHSDASYMTEKTMKPIVAHIPFLILSDHKFYDVLHEYGFETFGNIIDESFAVEPNLNIRIQKLVETIKQINPQELYERSREICEHNYDNLCIQNYRDKLRVVNDLSNFFSKFGY